MTGDAWNTEDPTVCPICRRESCDDPAHLPPPDQPRPNGCDHDEAPRRPRLRAQRATEIIDAPPPIEIVESLAWADSVTVLVGESGAGKTFMALDLAAAVSDGVTWHGRDVHPGSVVYVPYEGVLGLRLRALRERVSRHLEHLHVIRARDPLSPRVTREGEECSLGELAVIETIEALRDELAANRQPPIVLIVIDTVRASLSGSEDSSEHVSAYLRAVGRILAQVPGAAALLVHHMGWQDGESPRKRERGSSAWRGNVDGTLHLEAGEYDRERHVRRLVLRTVKVREGEEPPPLHLIRRRVDLFGMDRHQQPITSCIIERDQQTREDREAEQAQAAAAVNRAFDLTVLRTMRDCPDATSHRLLRAHLGVKMPLVEEAVARILSAQWAKRGKPSHPFQVTPAGHRALGATPDTATTPDDTRCRTDDTTPDTRPFRGGVGGGVGSSNGDRDATPLSVAASDQPPPVTTCLFSADDSESRADAPGRPPRRQRRPPRDAEARPATPADPGTDPMSDGDASVPAGAPRLAGAPDSAPPAVGPADDRDEGHEAEPDQAAEADGLDIRALRAIAERTVATSSQLRLALGQPQAVLDAALGRLLAQHWISQPEPLRQRYAITDAGRATLTSGGASSTEGRRGQPSHVEEARP